MTNPLHRVRTYVADLLTRAFRAFDDWIEGSMTKLYRSTEPSSRKRTLSVRLVQVLFLLALGLTTAADIAVGSPAGVLMIASFLSFHTLYMHWSEFTTGSVVVLAWVFITSSAFAFAELRKTWRAAKESCERLQYVANHAITYNIANEDIPDEDRN